MPHEEDAALADASRTVAIVNAMLAAKNGDPRRTSAGLITIAQILVQHDAVGRVALAAIMASAAAELLSLGPELLRVDTLSTH